ncbi:hypothetical protein MIND_00830100 [Mycena indigotica]|uniref:Uncharacterized protein n=1 Tax=Mycena indigotica TaxID=2126181 RepID=A0A8H6SJ71_9AGAR|nr:uncharacterized protein MIND_00830100 [Mycena indigotica]KAF7298825.1 hypothetical protein MIND_00830100 [Mycena indigotica]
MSDSDHPETLDDSLSLHSLASSLPLDTDRSVSFSDTSPSIMMTVPPHLRRKGAAFLRLEESQDELVNTKVRNAVRAHAALKKQLEEDVALETASVQVESTGSHARMVED